MSRDSQTDSTAVLPEALLRRTVCTVNKSAYSANRFTRNVIRLDGGRCLLISVRSRPVHGRRSWMPRGYSREVGGMCFRMEMWEIECPQKKARVILPVFLFPSRADKESFVSFC